MKNKVILISIDGMRPDGFLTCGNPYINELMTKSSYSLQASSVFPSVTLPCHMSMFHSVPPERHGTTTNTYMPQVRPINGLGEQIAAAGGVSAMFYGWEPLRDVIRPESLKCAEYLNAYAGEHTDAYLTERAMHCMRTYHPDFVFLYMVETDEKGGHDNGWMTPAYLEYISAAIDNVKAVVEEFGEEYTVIVTADHGGHDRAHGTTMPEDMVIPMFFMGSAFTPGKQLEGIGLLDIAPTVAALLSVPAAPEWEGRALV